MEIEDIVRKGKIYFVECFFVRNKQKYRAAFHVHCTGDSHIPLLRQMEQQLQVDELRLLYIKEFPFKNITLYIEDGKLKWV